MEKTGNKVQIKSEAIAETAEFSNNDHAVVRKVLAGDVNEYRLLVEKYQVPVYNLFLKMLNDEEQAKELTQQTFVKAYQALNKFRFEYRFFSWIYRIAINLALSALKREKKTTRLDEVFHLANEEQENYEDRDKLLKAAIQRLKDKYRVVVELKYFRGLNYNEIAEILEIEEKRVKSRLYDARLQLKKTLEQVSYFSR